MLFERINKRNLALYIAKACTASGLSVAIFLLFRDIDNNFPWAMASYTTSVTLPGVVAIVVGLIMLYGLWATILLRTARSPKYRALRLYFVFFGVGVITLIGLLREFGDSLFLPTVTQWLTQHGFMAFSVEASIFLIYALVLLWSAGIDRFLYKDTIEARKFRMSKTHVSAFTKSH